MKYPLYRMSHYPEWILRKRLYLDFSGRQKPKYSAPRHVPIPEERLRPALPNLTQIAGMPLELQAGD